MGAQQYGIIIFTHGEIVIDKKIYQIYRGEILIPFIAQTRVYYEK